MHRKIDKAQRDRTLVYDYFFDPDQTLKVLGERYGLEPYRVSAIISKHFQSVNIEIKLKTTEKRLFRGLVEESRQKIA